MNPDVRKQKEAASEPGTIERLEPTALAVERAQRNAETMKRKQQEKIQAQEDAQRREDLLANIAGASKKRTTDPQGRLSEFNNLEELQTAANALAEKIAATEKQIREKQALLDSVNTLLDSSLGSRVSRLLNGLMGQGDPRTPAELQQQRAQLESQLGQLRGIEIGKQKSTEQGGTITQLRRLRGDVLQRMRNLETEEAPATIRDTFESN